MADFFPRLRPGYAIYLYFLSTTVFTCRECKKKYTIKGNKEVCEHRIHTGICVNWYYECCNDYGDGCTVVKRFHNARVFSSYPKWDLCSYETNFSEIGPRVVLLFKLAHIWSNKFTRVHLQNSKLKYLDPAFMLPDISVLDVSNNKLTELPEELGEMTNLRTLNISNNKIKKLPDSLQKLYNSLPSMSVTGNPLDQKAITLFASHPPYAALYYLKCKEEGVQFELTDAPIPTYIQNNSPVQQQVFFTQTPSFEVPLDFFSYQIAPDITNSVIRKLVVKDCGIRLVTSVITAALKAHWTPKYWANASGVVIFANQDQEEVKSFLTELKQFLPDTIFIMLVVVVRGKDELKGSCQLWDLEEGDKKQIVQRTEVWVEQYDFSSVRKQLAYIGRNAVRHLTVKSTPHLLPEFQKFTEALLADFDPQEHFLGVKKPKAKEGEEGRKEIQKEIQKEEKEEKSEEESGKEKTRGERKEKESGKEKVGGEKKEKEGEKENCLVT